MHLCLLISGLMLGGGQRVVADLMDQMLRTGAADTGICLLGSNTNLFDRFHPQIVNYDGHYNRVGTLLGTARRLRAVLLANPPDILHTHGWDADIIGWLAVQGTAIKQITHLHVMPDWLESRRLKHLLRRWLTRVSFSCKNSTLVAVSDAVQRYWAEHLPFDEQKICVIRNGIDIDLYAPSEDFDARVNIVPVIGVAARLAPNKGVEYLIDALGVLKREGVDFLFKIAGEGSLKSTFASQADAVGIGERTIFCGHVQDISDYYRKIDIFVLPSIAEGMPLTVLEAMASGVPVIASAVGGIPEAVRDGIDGLLVPPRDSATMAAKLRILINDAEIRHRLGCSARQRAVEMFSLGRFICDMMRIYHKVEGAGCIRA